MTNLAPLFSSKSCEWATPQALFDKLNDVYHFDLDVCATSENAKCPLFFDKEANGLAQEWWGTAWMNPPYGREIGEWVKKAYEESLKGTTILCLLPTRTDTRWFHDYCLKGEVTFLRGRVKFGGHKNNAPFPSMLVLFKAV